MSKLILYQEDGVEKSRHSKTDWSSAATDRMSLQVMIETIAKAGYEVKKIERMGVRPLFLIYEVFHGKIKSSRPTCSGKAEA
jgi:hypothetical protein